MQQVHRLPGFRVLAQFQAKFVDCCLYGVAISSDRLLGEIVGVCVSATAMDIMVDRGEDTVWRPEHGYLMKALVSPYSLILESLPRLQSTHCPRPQIRFSYTGANIELINEVRVDDMYLVWIDPDDGSVLSVQLRNLPCVPSMLDYIIVELVPERHCCKLWAREGGDQAQV